jgi:glucuronate isomerase
MRAAGVTENYCTGDASPKEKFLAWARTVPHTLRNPLYHWTHLELKRYFDIDELLNEDTAESIWEKANERIGSSDFRVQEILGRFKVKLVGTTDDPTSTLEDHGAIAESGLETRVVPTFRPDKLLRIHEPKTWNKWVDALGAVAHVKISSLHHLMEALRKRHDFFGEMGARSSDHGLDHCPADFPSGTEAETIFDRVRAGEAATKAEFEKFASHIMLHVGRWNAEKGWAMQLHLGALRSANTRNFKALGPDTGFDSISDHPQIDSLWRFFDHLDQEEALPRTILYNLNPADNYAFAAMAGNFQDSTTPGKIQFGSGWWFLDQKEAMEWQMNALSNVGLISSFVGMLTDSRSFMSFPRHEYFRRVLCNLFGQEMERGELPDEFDLVGGMIRNICYTNIKNYLQLSS